MGILGGNNLIHMDELDSSFQAVYNSYMVAEALE